MAARSPILSVLWAPRHRLLNQYLLLLHCLRHCSVEIVHLDDVFGYLVMEVYQFLGSIQSVIHFAFDSQPFDPIDHVVQWSTVHFYQPFVDDDDFPAPTH